MSPPLLQWRASELLIPVFLQELTPNLPSLMLFLKEDMEQNSYINFFNLVKYGVICFISLPPFSYVEGKRAPLSGLKMNPEAYFKKILPACRRQHGKDFLKCLSKRVNF
jgi:hypothetical protein